MCSGGRRPSLPHLLAWVTAATGSSCQAPAAWCRLAVHVVQGVSGPLLRIIYRGSSTDCQGSVRHGIAFSSRRIACMYHHERVERCFCVLFLVVQAVLRACRFASRPCMCYQAAFPASRKRMLLPARRIQPMHKVLFAAVVQATLQCFCCSCSCCNFTSLSCMLVLVCVFLGWHLLVYAAA